MSQVDELKTKLALPPLSQIGMAVRDVDRVVDFYSSMLGIGPFNVYEFEAEKYWYMEEDEPSPFRVRQAKAMLGNIELELVQQLKGRSCFQEYVETHGEGLQHLGFNVSNYDAVHTSFIEAGFKPLLRVESYSEAYQGYLRACCFDTRETGGVVFEIIYKSWLLE